MREIKHYPKGISFHLNDRSDNPFAHPEVLEHTKRVFEGAVSKDGKWIKPLIATAVVVHDGIGLYTVVHNLGTRDYSATVSLIDRTGQINILSMGESSMQIEIRDTENNLEDDDFTIGISTTFKVRVKV